jgi:hypothetical protein
MSRPCFPVTPHFIILAVFVCIFAGVPPWLVTEKGCMELKIGFQNDTYMKKLAQAKAVCTSRVSRRVSLSTGPVLTRMRVIPLYSVTTCYAVEKEWVYTRSSHEVDGEWMISQTQTLNSVYQAGGAVSGSIPDWAQWRSWLQPFFWAVSRA